jgi:large subunit ribosomal protein L18
MINITKKRHKLRINRALRVRKKLHGTALKPRLCVLKTNKHIQVQLIDDDNHITLCSTGTHTKEFKNSEFARKNKASAAKIGEKIAELAQQKNIKEIVFDRGPFKYHGILAALADAVRNAGVNF